MYYTNVVSNPYEKKHTIKAMGTILFIRAMGNSFGQKARLLPIVRNYHSVGKKNIS